MADPDTLSPSRGSISRPIRTTRRRAATYIAAIAIFLGNLVAILSHIDEINTYIQKWLDLSGLIYYLTISRYATGTLGAIGFSALAGLFFVTTLDRAHRTVKVFYIAACAIGVPISFFVASQAVAVLDPKVVVEKERKILVQRILSYQDSDGGFLFSMDRNSGTQPWVSAQALTAVLAADSDLRSHSDKVKKGILYLLRARSNNHGWAYMGNSGIGVTEINSWVVLALLGTLKDERSGSLWTTSDRKIIVGRIRDEIDELANRQHTDGRWSPIYGTNSREQARTYSTIMALWALTEARATADVRAGDWRYDGNILRATAALLDDWSNEPTAGVVGWWPGSQKPTNSYPGLTAQALFILNKAALQFPSLASDQRLSNFTLQFLNSASVDSTGRGELIRRPIEDNDGILTIYRYVRTKDGYFEAELPTMLWYPWMLALSGSIEHRVDLDKVQRGLARKTADQLLRRVSSVDTFTSSAPELYNAAEVAIALAQVEFKDN